MKIDCFKLPDDYKVEYFDLYILSITLFVTFQELTENNIFFKFILYDVLMQKLTIFLRSSFQS